MSVVEAAAQFLADCTCLSGTFLRKRFAREATPVLQRLLAEGPTRRNIIAPGARCCILCLLMAMEVLNSYH